MTDPALDRHHATAPAAGAVASRGPAHSPRSTGAATVVSDGVNANTLRAAQLGPQALADLEFSAFVAALLEKLQSLEEKAFAYYNNLRRRNTGWANRSRWLLALLGSIAFLLTALAAALRFAPEIELQKWGLGGADKLALLAVLTIYAVMGSMSFYDRGTDKTTTYFRHVGIILAIRDLWTKLQFEFLKELAALRKAGDRTLEEPATRERLVALAAAFCTDLNKATSGELTEWRTEFLASLSELEAAAKQGSEDVTKQIREVVQAAEKAAADAKVAAQEAAADAQAAAKSAEDAAKPGGVNLTVVGDFDDQVVISVDGVEAAKSHGKTIALERVPPGQRKISAQAKKGPKVLEATYMVDIKPGLQDLKIALN